MVKKSIKWVYKNLICEFNHWDICTEGLIEVNGEKKYVKLCGGPLGKEFYNVFDIDWNVECDEYLTDYKKVYVHLFHKDEIDGKHLKLHVPYQNIPRGWFNKKWGEFNPIKDQTIKENNND